MKFIQSLCGFITIMPSSCGRKNNEGDYDKDLLGEEMVGIDISRSSASTFTIRLREREKEREEAN